MPLEFLVDGATPGLLAFGIGSVIVPPIEWLVHKYMLHDTKAQLGAISRSSTHSHDVVHHGAFRGPQHYYRDVTNEDETIHFGGKYVALILGSAAATGLVINRVYTALASSDQSLNFGDITGPIGFLIPGAIGYAGYEITHHYMHVIGERRLAINRELGDRIQGGRDGNLRMSKPVLDAIANSIEDYVYIGVKENKNDNRNSAPRFSVPQDLIDTANKQIAVNKLNQQVLLSEVSLEQAISEVAEIMLDRERKIRDSHSGKKAMKYWIEKRMQKIFRGGETIIGKYFKHIDNHHFGHHRDFRSNLNVFVTWPDYLFGTKKDTSVEELNNNHKYWLCPNSPDTEKFGEKYAKKHKSNI